MSEYENKVNAFMDDLNVKLAKKIFLNKFNKRKKDIEDLLDCPVQIDLSFKDKFKEEFESIEEGDESEMGDSGEDYWNYHGSVIREINDYGFNLEKKLFYLFGDVSEFSVSYVAAKLDTIQKLSPEPEKPITLQINTFGGDAYGMLGIVDLIKNSEVDINTVCYGQVMSAGAIVLIAGKHRVMSKNSVMMIHDLSTANSGNYKDIKNSVKHLDYIQNLVYNFLAENSNKTFEWWEDKLQRDFYLTPSEAEELGLIDEII